MKYILLILKFLSFLLLIAKGFFSAIMGVFLFIKSFFSTLSSLLMFVLILCLIGLILFIMANMVGSILL